MVYLWVPTKGWKLVFDGFNEKEAREAAEELLPLEVKLENDKGYRETAGRAHAALEGDLSLPQTFLSKVAS